jgi:hypothetical protein
VIQMIEQIRIVKSPVLIEEETPPSIRIVPMAINITLLNGIIVTNPEQFENNEQDMGYTRDIHVHCTR